MARAGKRLDGFPYLFLGEAQVAEALPQHQAQQQQAANHPRLRMSRDGRDAISSPRTEIRPLGVNSLHPAPIKQIVVRNGIPLITTELDASLSGTKPSTDTQLTSL